MDDNGLSARITPGWTVDITDHDYLADSREGAHVEQISSEGMIFRPRRPWSSQGRTFTVGSLAWEGGDWEFDGDTARLFHTPPPHTGKSRRLIKTYRFHPPRETL